MLNFKVGKTYKDFLGKEWEFCSYCSTENYPYRFKDKYGDIKSFREYTDTIVTEWDDGTGIRIPFVEEKERDWVVGEEYECYEVNLQTIIKAPLVEIDKQSTFFKYMFNVGNCPRWFVGVDEVLCAGPYVIFKNGVPQELKDKLNKKKLTNKRKRFQKGKTYKNSNGYLYKFIKRIKTQRGLLAVFEKEDGLIYFDNLYKVNNIECIPFSYNSVGMFLCADESIREESSNKAVRVMQ